MRLAKVRGVAALQGFQWQCFRTEYNMPVQDFEEWKGDAMTRKEALRAEGRIFRRYSLEDGTAVLDVDCGALWVGSLPQDAQLNPGSTST